MERDVPPPDWREILHTLSLNTLMQSGTWHKDGLRILVPEAAIGRLLYGADDNIWSIKRRTGCDLEAMYLKDSTDKFRTLSLSGPATNIMEAAREISRIAPESLADDQKSSDLVPIASFKTWSPKQAPDQSSDPRSVIRVVPSRKRTSHVLPIAADKIPRPQQWTKESFADYITRITTTKGSNHLSKVVDSETKCHQETVRNIILSVVEDDACKDVLSTTAMNEAMAWLMARSQIRDVRILFTHMELRGVKMDTETFNIMLRGAAKFHDIHTFRFVLGLMLNRGLQPNVGTWLAFMRSVDDVQIKRYVLEGIKQKSLLQNVYSLRALCNELAKEEILSSLKHNQTLQDFLVHMDRKYGSEWLSVEAGNKILFHLGENGLIERALRFLDVMLAREVRPDAVTINTILTHCRNLEDPDAAIRTIRKVTPSMAWTPDDVTFQLLMSLAQRAKLYNTARVAWRYACLDACTTRWMRRWVQSTLIHAVGVPVSAANRHRYDGFGTAFGLPIDSSKHPANQKIHGSDTLPTTSEDEGGSSCPATYSAKSTDLVKLSKELMRLDLRMFMDWKASTPLVDMLQRALELDGEIAGMLKENKHANLEDIVRERRIHVPVLKRRNPRSTTEDVVIWS
jgi:pentatricopeptide repeat protein